MLYINDNWWYENKIEKYFYVRVTRTMYGVNRALKLRRLFDDLGYVKGYTDYDRDIVYFYKKWLLPFAKLYWYYTYHRYDIERFLVYRNIIKVKEGDYLKNWKFNWDWRWYDKSTWNYRKNGA